MRNVKRGQIYWADLSPVIGSEQGGLRPVLIIQNNKGNLFAPTTITAIITTRKTKANLPTHYWLDETCGLPSKSMVELEQIRTIDKSRLGDKIGEVSTADMFEIDRCLATSLALI